MMDWQFSKKRPAEQAKILNRRADDALSRGDYVQYKEQMEQARDLARQSGDQELLGWLEPKASMEAMEKAKIATVGKMYATKFKEAHPNFKEPEFYEMPPRPPAQFAAAREHWDIINAAREYGMSEAVFSWDKEAFGTDHEGRVPAPVRENWVSWGSAEMDEATGEMTYSGERRPEHQAALDRQEAKRWKEYAESGQQAHDEQAAIYQAEMVSPKHDLLAQYYQESDPEKRDRIMEQINKSQTDQGQQDFETAELADRIRVREWEKKKHDRETEWIQKLRDHYASYDQESGVAASPYPGTKEEYMADFEEPPEIAELRDRIKERDANRNFLDAVGGRSRQFFEEEKERTQEVMDAMILAESEAGNTTSPRVMRDRINTAAQQYRQGSRQLRVRAQREAVAGNYEAAGELMARQEFLHNFTLDSASSGAFSPEAVVSDMFGVTDDKSWAQQREALLSDPANKPLADKYMAEAKANQEDFTAAYSEDVGEQLTAMKAQTARFDTGRAQQLGLEPGQTEMPKQQMAGEQQKLPPVAGAEPDAQPEAAAATPEPPESIRRPEQAAAATPPPTGPPGQVGPPGGQAGAAGAPGMAGPTSGGKSLMPDRLRPNSEPSSQIDAGSSNEPVAGGPGLTPTAPPMPGQPGQPGQPGATSLAPSNAEAAGVGKPGTPQVGINKEKTQAGNPNLFTGVGLNRRNPAGESPNQLARFTAGHETRTLNTRLFPRKEDSMKKIPKPGAQGGSSLKLGDFRGGHFKEAKFLRSRETPLAKVPLVGGALQGFYEGMQDMLHFAGTGEKGRAGRALGSTAGNAALLVGSVYGGGALARRGGALAMNAGRSIFARGAAREAGRLALGNARSNAATAVTQPFRNMGSAAGWGRNAAGVAKAVVGPQSLLFTGGITAIGLNRVDQATRMGRIAPDGMNLSLLERVRGNKQYYGKGFTEMGGPTLRKPKAVGGLSQS